MKSRPGLALVFVLMMTVALTPGCGPPRDETETSSTEPGSTLVENPVDGGVCTALYALGSTRYRYVLRPATQNGDRYALLCGPEGNEVQATDIEVTPASNLRLVNAFEQALRWKVNVPSSRSVFGFRTAWVYIPPLSSIDLRVQEGADPTGAQPYALSVQIAPNGASWQEKTHGDPDPKLKVKGG